MRSWVRNSYGANDAVALFKQSVIIVIEPVGMISYTEWLFLTTKKWMSGIRDVFVF